jgi:hypothetical protein
MQSDRKKTEQSDDMGKESEKGERKPANWNESERSKQIKIRTSAQLREIHLKWENETQYKQSEEAEPTDEWTESNQKKL